MTVLIRDTEAVAMLSRMPGADGYCRKFDELYHIEERLHSGAYGTVYRVTDRQHSNKELATKVIKRSKLSSKQESDILSEVNVMKDLAGVENVVQVVDFFAEEDAFYIVQQLARGGDLFEKVVNGYQYSEHNARTVALKLLQTLRKLHDRGVVHRDLKPENLLLSSSHDNTSVQLADFGFATYLPEGGYLDRRCGTPCYTSPEVWQKKPYNTQADMWSLGNVLYMLIDGRPPFYSKDTVEAGKLVCKGSVKFEGKQWDGISDAAKQCIRGLLTVDPTQRWTAEKALQSSWIQSGLTDALFENLDWPWMPSCSQHEDVGNSYVFVTLNLG
ncbi:MAP kinase-activated protein kinase 2 (Fragment) [Seminavis robusta]|uniref:MAP kinase-activated protein kinase 2 n=1 Tax=Seminavis robusta TaxID=568900 RepID=A0A9N8HYG6_9STRA